MSFLRVVALMLIATLFSVLAWWRMGGPAVLALFAMIALILDQFVVEPQR